MHWLCDYNVAVDNKYAVLYYGLRNILHGSGEGNPRYRYVDVVVLLLFEEGRLPDDWPKILGFQEGSQKEVSDCLDIWVNLLEGSLPLRFIED